MPLKTDYKNDVLNTSVNINRKYKMENNSDGTVSLMDFTVYSQEGSVFGADDFNATNSKVNEIDSKLIASDGFNFRFATNGEGKYGYLGADDSFIPFSKGGTVIASKYYSPVGIVDDTYTIEEDGYLWVTANNVNTIYHLNIYLNGVATSDYGTYTSGEGNYMSLSELKGRAVKKGDTIRIRSENRGSGSHRCNYFIILVTD